MFFSDEVSYNIAGTQSWQRVWSQQGDSIPEPEGPPGVLFPNYVKATEMWKPTGSTVGVKMYNIASGLFGRGIPLCLGRRQLYEGKCLLLCCETGFGHYGSAWYIKPKSEAET